MFKIPLMTKRNSQGLRRSRDINPVTSSVPLPSASISEYPLLRTYGRILKERGIDFSGSVFILAMHFLPNLVDFITVLSGLGLPLAQTWLLYKDYGYCDRSVLVEHLRERGAHIGSLSKASELIEEALTQATRLDCYVLGIEDGGKICCTLHREFPDSLDLVRGLVEQTERGIRNIADLGKNNLRFPVIDVARSRMKSENEPPHVARSVLANIQNLLSELTLSGKWLAVFGYGRVGRCIAIEAQRTGMYVRIYDQNDERLLQASNEGFIVAGSARVALKDAQIVIGATGETSISVDTFDALEHNCYLVSASSNSTEIDIDALCERSQEVKCTENEIQYKLEPDGRIIHILAHGRPVNFHRFSAVPGEIIDLVLTSLLIAAAEISQGGNSKPMIHSVDPLLSKHKIARRYLEIRRRLY